MKLSHFSALAIVFLLLVMSLGCDSSAGGDTQFTNENDLKAYGMKIYQTQCTKCHTLEGKSIQGNCIDLTQSKMDETDIGNLIYHGKKEMPGYNETLGEPEILAVSRYCRSLQQK